METKKEWELHPEKFLQNEDGSFKLKKDGTPKRKPGARGRNLHSETKAKLAARKKVREAKRKADALERRANNAKARYKKVNEVAKKLDGKLGVTKKTSAVVSESDIDILPEATKREITENGLQVLFKPHPGPQTDFLAASETEVLYGGAAGGGKSYAMLMDPLRYAHIKDHKFLILRRTLGELQELMDKARELYPSAYPGAKWNESKKTWNFPSGAKGIFGYLERDADVYQYQGLQYSWIGFDEITHLPTSFAWDFLRSRLRTVNPDITCYMRATANPGGPGHGWVKKRFIDPASPNTTFWSEDGEISRKFIPAKLADNPSLSQDGKYEGMLRSLDPIHRARLLEGDWDVNDGAAFPEFSTSTHVIPPMQIPTHWERFKAIDYGYRAPSCCLWFAIDPSDGTLIVYRELYEKGLDGTALAERIHDREMEEMMDIRGVLDGASWNQTGASGPTVGEALVKAGHKLRRADKNRVAGKIQIHERLKLNMKTGRPRMLVTSACSNLISELLSIPEDPNNKEDVDTTVADHAYDACRYGVMSRPRVDDPFLRMQRYKNQRPQALDTDFGY